MSGLRSSCVPGARTRKDHRAQTNTGRMFRVCRDLEFRPGFRITKDFPARRDRPRVVDVDIGKVEGEIFGLPPSIHATPARHQGVERDLVLREEAFVVGPKN